MGSAVKYTRWGILGLLIATALAQSQAVYNYFPPPGITYTPTGGMALGSASGGVQGQGTLNAQGLYIDGVAVGTGAGSVTSVSVANANGLSGIVATPNTTPAITLSPTFTGIAYSSGSGFSAAVASNFPTLNQNTTGNAATAATATTAGSLASTPSLCGSGQAAQGILANGNATGCITPFSVVNESANTMFAGPQSGTAALPSFRLLVPADLPLSSPLTFTGDLAMTPVGGVALTINGYPSADALDVNNGSGQYAKIIGNGTTGQSNGLAIVAGTNSSDTALNVSNHAGTRTMFSVRGDGLVTVPDSSGGGPFQVGYLGTPLSAQGGSYTLALSDRGKTIELNGASGTVTIPSGIFSAGDVITIVAMNGTTSYTISPGSGVTLYWAIGNVTSGSRTLTSVGLATIMCLTSSSFLITGSGVT